MKGSSHMKKYNASVSGMQLSIWDYIKEIDQEQKEKLAQSTIDQKARTGAEDWCPMSGIASGNVIVMPNRNKGMIQTGMPIESNILRHNPKTKELESVPVLKIPGKLSSEYLPTVCPPLWCTVVQTRKQTYSNKRYPDGFHSYLSGS